MGQSEGLDDGGRRHQRLYHRGRRSVPGVLDHCGDVRRDRRPGGGRVGALRRRRGAAAAFRSRPAPLQPGDCGAAGCLARLVVPLTPGRYRSQDRNPREGVMSRTLIAFVAALLLPGYAAAFELQSPQVKEGGTIAAEQVLNAFGCTGGNVSPELNWHDAPADTKS